MYCQKLVAETTHDPDRPYPRLARAPIVEAVIYWQAPASPALDLTTLRAALLEHLPDYPEPQELRHIQVSMGAADPANATLTQSIRWNGFRLTDRSGKYVAQFAPSGVVFSRLAPYEDWQRFHAEAMRFWQTFRELAAPEGIQRLGVRYINRILLRDSERPSVYLNQAPAQFAGLDVRPHSFVYQDTYAMPNSAYQVNLVRAVQTQPNPALIVDIDVFSKRAIALESEAQTNMLEQLRALKNKIFFNCITQTALDRFQAS